MLWRDQGFWLLLPLLLLVAVAFRRGSVFALLAACMLLPWQPAHAADPEDWWRRPDQQAHARMEAGAQAYQKGAFDQALGQWQGLAGADAAYNRGNALARLGQFPEAIAAYDEALRLHPGMADAIANRKAVEAAMKRPPSGGGKQDKPSGKPDDSGGQQGEPQRGGQGDGKTQPGQQTPVQQQQDSRDGKPQAGRES